MDSLSMRFWILAKGSPVRDREETAVSLDFSFSVDRL